MSPDLCGSMDWVSSYKAEGGQLDSWSGHVPAANDQCFSHRCVSPSLSSSFPLAKNKKLNLLVKI